MRKILIYSLLAFTIYSCGSSDRGELVGVTSKGGWFPEKPYGMSLIPGGSFTMGKTDEDFTGSLNTPVKTVTVRPFYMDETEITNGEYKKFVFWVRDSIIRTKLALMAEEASFGNTNKESKKKNEGIQKYKFVEQDTSKMTVYQKYMIENYGSLGDLNSPTEGRSLNWKVNLIFDKNDYPDQYYAEVMDSMSIPIEDSHGGNRPIDTRKLKYTYLRTDNEKALKKGAKRKNYIKKEILNIYPDTTVWIKDFKYSYNDPMHKNYFWHRAYTDYPVVGITWHQAIAFCNWRTKMKNDYLASRSKKNTGSVPEFRLPTEAEWEYAARGGLEGSKYPWGGPYVMSDRGCFLANFKPKRGDYAADGALYTVEAKSYNPNGYGLYNMAGNVAEWTESSFIKPSYYEVSNMNPNINDYSNKRKITRGGSWKDVAYFLEVSTKDYEYADSARSYIGFRTVQDYMGAKIDNKKRKKNKKHNK